MGADAPRTLVIVPTYDEIENVTGLVPKILKAGPNIEVLIVDDNSPDGTGEWAERMSQEIPRVHSIRRPSKMGLGSAYRDGFRYALQHGAELIFEMDADYSHDGVTVVNWPLRRLVLSYGANLFSRIVTGLPVKDATGGFKCFRREVLETIDLDRVKSDGYSFQIEMSFLAWRLGFRIVEIPIVFLDRRVGISKMNKGIILEAILMVWHLGFVRIFTRHPRRKPIEGRR
jgi:dolichol-phosphate mannosyltransferase